jgi:N-acetylmuramoyl-L-alanine amidase
MNIIESNLQWHGELQDGNNPNLLILHHAEASICTIEDIHKWHLNNGWCGVGYHFFVRKDGSIYRGRPENVIGAHCLGYNTNSLGVCAEGAYMTETMPEAQKQAIIELGKYLCSKYGIQNIKGHKELNPTDCPGINYPLNNIRQAILSNQATVTVNPVIASIQKLCNSLSIKDSNGNALDVDGEIGTLTNSAIAKLPLIQRGSKGDYVKWLQQRLIDLGFSCGIYGADGDFGYCTMVAVQNFQAKHGLCTDGIVGQQTLAALLK